MQRIVYTDPETGNLAVITPVSTPPDPPMTDDEILQRAIGHVPQGVDYHLVEESDMPDRDSTFRNAWTYNGTAVVHDMEAARSILKNRLRTVREPKLSALDIQYQRADETGDATKKQQVAQQKQVLRDWPEDPRIAAATTVDDLKTILSEAENT